MQTTSISFIWVMSFLAIAGCMASLPALFDALGGGMMAGIAVSGLMIGAPFLVLGYLMMPAVDRINKLLKDS